MKLKATAAVLGLAALAAGPVPSALLPMAAFDAAYADSGKGNGASKSESRGNSAASQGNASNAHVENASASNHSATATATATATAAGAANGKGALASELKGLNAVKANPNALDHASPNSQVGRIAAYRDAARITLGAQTALTDAEATLDGLDVPARDTDAIDADIAALDPAAADYNDALAALQTERDAAQAYADAAAAVDLANEQLATTAEKENAALLAASDGRVLSAEAIAYLRSVLKL